MLYLLGVSLWLAYGIRIDAAEVIGANIIASALVFTAFFMKLRSKTSCAHFGMERFRKYINQPTGEN